MGAQGRDTHDYVNSPDNSRPPSRAGQANGGQHGGGQAGAAARAVSGERQRRRRKQQQQQERGKPKGTFGQSNSRDSGRSSWIGGTVRGGVVLGVDLPAIEAEIIAQARAASGRMQALKPVLDRSKTTLDAYYRAGGHGKRVRRAH